MARGDAAEMIARTGPALRNREWLVRAALVQVLTADAQLKARTRGSRLEFDQGHQRLL
jgi:hypothetical protein